MEREQKGALAVGSASVRQAGSRGYLKKEPAAYGSGGFFNTAADTLSMELPLLSLILCPKAD